MSSEQPDRREIIARYIDRAHTALHAAQVNLDNGLYETAVNRAYYAVFYASSALLLTRDISRSKHSGVLAAFRQQFVKTGEIEPEFSDSYGELLTERTASDYDLAFMADGSTARRHLDEARRFVERIERRLKETGHL